MDHRNLYTRVRICIAITLMVLTAERLSILMARTPTSPPNTKRTLWRSTKHFLSKALLAPYITSNLDVITPQCYRSCQPTGKMLKKLIKRQGITTVINLRDDAERDANWHDEIAITREFGVTFHHVPMDNHAYVTPAAIEQLLAIYTSTALHTHTTNTKNTPQKLLLHCHHGSDRTGFAAALFVYEIENWSFEEALGQLSLAYRHVQALYPRMRESFIAWHNACTQHPGNDVQAQAQALAAYTQWYQVQSGRTGIAHPEQKNSRSH